MINYQQIIEDLRDDDVFHLLEQLGAQPIDKETYFLCRTICHNEDAEEASYKLYYYKNSHMFYCYTECGSMSIFKFLKNYYDARNITYDWYNDILQVILNCSANLLTGEQGYRSHRGEYEAHKLRKDLPEFPVGVLDCFTEYYPVEWLRDGITIDAMKKFDIKYSISQNKIIIPHFDAQDRLVGIRGRALNAEEAELYGKYMPIQLENKWYSHPLSLNVYGLNKTKENITKYGIVFIFESEKSVLQCENFSMPNCAVASCGSNLNKFQVDILFRLCHPKEFVLCYDNEENEGEDKYFNKLYNMCKKYVNYANMSFIYDRQGLSKAKDSPSDNGEAIFKQLLESRVKIR